MFLSLFINSLYCDVFQWQSEFSFFMYVFFQRQFFGCHWFSISTFCHCFAESFRGRAWFTYHILRRACLFFIGLSCYRLILYIYIYIYTAQLKVIYCCRKKAVVTLSLSSFCHSLRTWFLSHLRCIWPYTYGTVNCVCVCVWVRQLPGNNGQQPHESFFFCFLRSPSCSLALARCHSLSFSLFLLSFTYRHCLSHTLLVCHTSSLLHFSLKSVGVTGINYKKYSSWTYQHYCLTLLQS